jgi:hypothetical protein
MDFDHLSASSMELFLECPARWKARYDHPVAHRDTVGATATLGKACHKALEIFYREELYDTYYPLGALLSEYDKAFSELFHTQEDSIKKLGMGLLTKWYSRQTSFDKPLSIELEETFEIQTKAGPKEFLYFIDRLDMERDGPSVYDYKTGRWTLNHKQLRKDIQAKSYATATWLKYPEFRGYWVTFDYLRNEPIGVSFKPDELEEFYYFICETADKILESDGSEERLNKKCTFCVRKSSCAAISRNVAAGGIIGSTVEDLVTDRIHVNIASTTLKANLAEIDELLMAAFRNLDTNTLDGIHEDHILTYSSRNWTVVDMAQVKDVLSNTRLAQYAKMTVDDVRDEILTLLASNDIDAANRLERAIKRTKTAPSIRRVD